LLLEDNKGLVVVISFNFVITRRKKAKTR
jgi:hypothetical protein